MTAKRRLFATNTADEYISHQPLDDAPAEATEYSQSQYSAQPRLLPNGSSQTAFSRLPPKVIQRILWTVDSDAFASLSVVNRQWYKAAQVLELYAHHLSRCPSYALSNTVITGPFRRNDFYRIKTKFAAEVRRNLFEAYMRPRETLVNLISINANSSAAFPGGEAFRFAFSPNGHTVLALGSSRIYVLDVTSDPIAVRRELKTLRRPLSASITDDGSLLAVLSSKHQANIYGLTDQGPKHLQVLVLDNAPRTIALAHEGTVLAAAYEGGIEVFSLAANALSTDRRAVRSEAVDTLMFSGDGSMLVGSSQRLDEPNAVVVTAPFYTENDPDMSSREVHSRMWTTQILFPQISSVCSHAELLQGHAEGDANWLFAYDHSLMSYRAVRTDDTRTGVAYFLNPSISRRFSTPAPTTAPTASACGTLVVAGFGVAGLCLYGVPERLDVSPDMGSVVERHEARFQGKWPLTSATGVIEPLMAYSPSVSGSSEEIEDDSLAAKVDWRQSLFVKCRPLKSISGYTGAKWVERSEKRSCDFGGKRLVIVAPGGVNEFAEDLGDESMPVDGSRICLLDFDYSPSTGSHRELTIEVGEKGAELLTEYSGDLDVEVAMERRRTVRGLQGIPNREVIDRSGAPIGRSVTASAATTGSYFQQPRRASLSQASSPSEGQMSTPTPGSPANLQRSATAAGFQTARFPPRPPLGSGQYQSMGHAMTDSPNGQQGQFDSPPPPYRRGSAGANTPRGAFSSPSGDTWYPIPQSQLNGYLQTPVSAASTNNTMQNYQNLPSHYAGQQPSFTTMSPTSRTTSFGTMPLAPVDESATNHQVPQSLVTQPNLTSIHQSAYQATSQRMVQTHYPPVQTQLPPHPGYAQQHLDGARHSPGGSITLTGANLQNRLNHPVPPTPDMREQQGTQSHQQAPHFQQGWQHDATTNAYIPPNPTADQLANLNRRMSGSRPRPGPVNTSGRPNGNNTTATHDFGRVPPSPPRAAWGAAGVPGSPSFNKANNLSRNNSTGSQRSIPQSMSAPNLLHSSMNNHNSHNNNQRPKYGRLDTIDSVSSAFVPGETASRSRAHSINNRDNRTPTPSGGYYQQQPPQIHEIGGRRIATDPEVSKKVKKNRKGRDETIRPQSALGFESATGGQYYNDTASATEAVASAVPEKKEKKKSRCLVM